MQNYHRKKNSFLQHFSEDGSSKYLAHLADFVSRVQSYKGIPEQLKTFCFELEQRMPGIEKLEKRFHTAISDELAKAINISGLVTLECNKHEVEITDSEVCGYRRFAQNRFEDKLKKSAKWTQGSIAKFLGINEIADYFTNRHNKYWQSIGFGTSIITELPREFANTLTQLVSDQIAYKNEDTIKILSNDNYSFTVDVFFTFENNILAVYITNIQPRINEKCKFHEEAKGMIHKNFSGYSDEYIKSKHRLWNQLVEEKARSMKNLQHFIAVTQSISDASWFNTPFEIDIESQIFQAYGYRSIGSICDVQPELADQLKAIQAFRAWADEHIKAIHSLVSIASAYTQKSKDWEISFSFPKIREYTAHTVSFETLMPIHLIGRKIPNVSSDANEEDGITKPEQLVEISGIPELNGRMVSLTGSNAVGKTVVLEELSESLYLAHCGFPVFGEKLSFNPKQALAVVFIERGDGSTAQLLGQKISKVLSAVSEYKKHEILVVIDELGTGTQLGVGLQLGSSVLRKLREYGCSVVFSTQIPELAQLACDDMDSIPFQFKQGHTITDGIGNADYGHLLEQSGLNKHLVAEAPQTTQ